MRYKYIGIQKCEFCDGYGVIPGIHLAYPVCKVCRGSGKTSINWLTHANCRVCNGIGRRSPLPNKLTPEITMIMPAEESIPATVTSTSAAPDQELKAFLSHLVEELKIVDAIPVIEQNPSPTPAEPVVTPEDEVSVNQFVANIKAISAVPVKSQPPTEALNLDAYPEDLAIIKQMVEELEKSSKVPILSQSPTASQPSSAV